MTNPADTPVDDPHTRRILDLVARGQARSRSELAATMGVAASTVGLRVQALLDAGIPMDYSCEGGVCGTCVVPLVSGQVEHMDEFLMDDEHEDQMITCVSRGEGEIEIDV